MEKRREIDWEKTEELGYKVYKKELSEEEKLENYKKKLLEEKEKREYEKEVEKLRTKSYFLSFTKNVIVALASVIIDILFVDIIFLWLAEGVTWQQKKMVIVANILMLASTILLALIYTLIIRKIYKKHNIDNTFLYILLRFVLFPVTGFLAMLWLAIVPGEINFSQWVSVAGTIYGECAFDFAIAFVIYIILRKHNKI